MNMKKIILCIGLIGLTSVYADIPIKEFRECSIIESFITRNKCFDSLAEKYKTNSIEISEDETQDFGDWKYDYFVDEFGDKTTDGYISVSSNGKFSNSATTNSELYVRMFLSNGSLENPWFRIWEYNSSLVKNTYGDDNYDCIFKDNEGNRFNGAIYQRENWDYFLIKDQNTKNMIAAKIRTEGSIKIACTDRDNLTTKYVFPLNFKNFSNVLNTYKNQN